MNFWELLFHPTSFFFKNCGPGWKQPVAFFLITILGFQVAGAGVSTLEASLFGALGFPYSLTLFSFLHALAYSFARFAVVGLGVCLLLYLMVHTTEMGKAWKVLMYAQFPALFFLFCMGLLTFASLIMVPAPPAGSSYIAASSYGLTFAVLELITYGLMLTGLIWTIIIAVRGLVVSYKIPPHKACIALILPLLAGLALFDLKLCTSVISSAGSVISTALFHPELL